MDCDKELAQIFGADSVLFFRTEKMLYEPTLRVLGVESEGQGRA